MGAFKAEDFVGVCGFSQSCWCVPLMAFWRLQGARRWARSRRRTSWACAASPAWTGSSPGPRTPTWVRQTWLPRTCRHAWYGCPSAHALGVCVLVEVHAGVRVVFRAAMFASHAAEGWKIVSRKAGCHATEPFLRMFRCGAGATTVPLPTNISAEDIAKIAVEAEIRAMVCSAAELRAVAPVLASIPTLRTFIVMDLPRDLDAATQEALRKVFVQVPLKPCPDPECTLLPVAPSPPSVQGTEVARGVTLFRRWRIRSLFPPAQGCSQVSTGTPPTDLHFAHQDGTSPGALHLPLMC